MKKFSRSVLGVILMLIGLILFCKGFLLVRKVSSVKNDHQPINKKFFDKVVILLFDAVRFDMVIPNEGKEKYNNKFTSLYEFYKKEPSRALLYRFKADPPTVTTQRIAGLTAGNLPTFIEVGDSFSGNSSPQDNWIYQLIQAKKKVCFFGDDTWINMYPYLESNNSGLVKGFHSFHLFDLHTVDDGIEAEIPKVLESKNFDVVIAHYLGFDHCGHKYGPNHEKCASKLEQYDKIVRRSINELPQSSLLVVMSDHGMTDEGDHGGISPKELSSLLFLYSKEEKWNLTNFSEIIEARNDNVSAKELNFFNSKGEIPPTVEQVDFCPTISMLLGLPIPFGNLGKLIPEVFSFLPKDDIVSLMKENLRQINNFIDTLKDSNFIKYKGGDDLNELFTGASVILKQARSVWATFNYPLMIYGLLVMFIGCVILSSPLMNDHTGRIIIIGSILYTLILSATSFIVFESWVVRFLLTAFFLFQAIHDPEPNSFYKHAILAVLVRCSYLFGSCREEQFPYCSVLNHRSIEPNTNILLVLSLVLFGITGEKKSLLLYSYLMMTWVKDTLKLNFNPIIDRIIQLYFPQVLILYYILNFFVSNDDNINRTSYLLGMFQRPFGGLFLLIFGNIINHEKKIKKLPVVQILLPLVLFFSTGHQITISGIQWESAYVGNESSFQPLLMSLLMLNMFGGHLFAIEKVDLRYLLVFHGICLLGISGFSMILIRHLMIWKIFGPRFLFQILQFLFYSFLYFIFKKNTLTK